MSDDVRFERLLADVLSDSAPTRVPDRLVPDILAAASHTRRRPRWLALATEPPMRRHAEVLVGSPTVRLAYPFLMAALLALLAVAALVVGGIVRPPELAVVVVPSPSLQGIVAPSSTPNGPSARPTASPVTDPAGVWIATGTMGSPRVNHAAVRLLDGRVLVVGGERSSRGEPVTSVELYDPVTGTWSTTGSMLKGHEGLATLLRDGRVLVSDRSGSEVYDPASGTWTATGQMVRGADFVGDRATVLQDGKVLVAGLNGAQLYDPASGTWSATGKMTIPRYYAAATLLSDGRVLVAGGDVPPDFVVDSAELYDPDTQSWTAVANMQAPRAPIGAFQLPDGKVLVIGKTRGGDPQSVELYDPVAGAWIATGSMVAPRFDYAAASLADGKVLVVGGFDTSGVLPSAELYDPGTGTWITTAPMLGSHVIPGERGSPAIALLDGTVLVAGGSDCLDDQCVATGSAELYIPAGVSPPALPAFPSPPLPVFPSPTPIPPPPAPLPPEAGPVPAGARSWKVTVRNDSSVPATLFLAEDGETGSRQLCGSVTPNVVPAGVTEQVTFLLPPKNVRGCWIDVNPVQGDVPGWIETSEAPMAGRIVIREDGDSFWVGP